MPVPFSVPLRSYARAFQTKTLPGGGLLDYIGLGHLCAAPMLLLSGDYDLALDSALTGAERLISFGAMAKFAKMFCFPAGTPVWAEHGRRPIEEIQAGDRVWAYDFAALRWVLRPVLETYVLDYSGDLVRFATPDGDMHTTGGHPFWVVSGEGLAERPLPDHIDATEGGTTQPGRWVNARDLRDGDLLLLRSGLLAAVSDVRVGDGAVRVYNFHVDGLENYAVGDGGILVHNTNSAPKSPDIHHLMTNKNKLSTAAGGPYTPKFEALARQRGTTLEDSLNKIALPGHKGPHPEYNKLVYERMLQATKGLTGDKFNKAYDKALDKIRTETLTPGTKLNQLATGG